MRARALATVMVICVLLAGCQMPGNSDERGSAERNQVADDDRFDPATMLILEETAAPRFARLDGEQIRRRLIGHRVLPDDDVRQPAPAFMAYMEDFFPDGSWMTYRSERGPIIRPGRWRIVADRICVASEGHPTLCRSVWHDTETGKVGMSDLGVGRPLPVLILAGQPLDQVDRSPTR